MPDLLVFILAGVGLAVSLRIVTAALWRMFVTREPEEIQEREAAHGRRGP